MSQRSCYWSITINNPTTEDDTEIALLQTNKLVKEFKYQLEEGENGTKHYQGCLHTQSIKFSAVKKLLKRAHIEVARNPFALQQYVEKEDTRLEAKDTIKTFQPKDFYDALLEYPREQEDNLTWCDRVARRLIEKGTQGVEYWISNPMVRSALKNFLSSIIIRHNGSRQTLPTPRTEDEAQEESSSSPSSHND